MNSGAGDRHTAEPEEQNDGGEQGILCVVTAHCALVRVRRMVEALRHVYTVDGVHSVLHDELSAQPFWQVRVIVSVQSAFFL